MFGVPNLDQTEYLMHLTRVRPVDIREGVIRHQGIGYDKVIKHIHSSIHTSRCRYASEGGLGETVEGPSMI